jgi:drebrin-like protein
VQITARSDRDLTPEGIIQKIADSSGSKYSAREEPPTVAAATKPTVASKPAFTPTQSSGGGGYNPGFRNRPSASNKGNLDEDGWGEDAPPITRTQLEKVQSAYQPTKVNLKDMASENQPQRSFNDSRSDETAPGIVKGAYQPVGKVDVAAIRQQAQDSSNTKDNRPEIVKGSYEPVGKVDIAAIRAKAQRPSDSPILQPSAGAAASNEQQEEVKPVSERSAAFSTSERMTSLPKPKVANKFGGGSSFTGTKAPTPGGFEAKPVSSAAPVGTASRTFADQGGKTPAQLWAEKKARERGMSGSAEPIQPSYSGQAPLQSQTSGGEWKSGYTGKSWAPVHTTHTGKSAASGTSIDQQRTGDVQSPAGEDAPQSPAGGISSIRDRFSGAPPMGAPATNFERAAPEPDTSSKPNRGIPIPGLPTQPSGAEAAPSMPTPPPQRRSPTPPTPEMRSTSPIRVAMPVARGATPEVADAHNEQMSPPPAMPVRSMGRIAPEPGPEDDEPDAGPDPARAQSQSTAAASFGQAAVDNVPSASSAGGGGGGKRALVQYDYEAAGKILKVATLQT